jgi:aldehyde:ferredoxin oxidoreductase
LLKSIEMIALRQGFGNTLAEGVARMSQQFGPQTDRFNLTIKGQELPMHEPRLKGGMGIGYAVAPVGADHMMNIHDTEYTTEGEGLRKVNEFVDKRISPLSAQAINEDKLQILFHELNFNHFQDCAVNCRFYPYHYGHLATALSGVMGIPFTVNDIMTVGRRAQTLSRLFNQKEGFTTKDDRLPDRVRQAFKSGPLTTVEITDSTFDWAIHRFYKMMSWNPDNGEVNDEVLNELGLTGILNS